MDRPTLHASLEGILGSNKVYFQAPSVGLTYPCILYKIYDIDQTYATNSVYGVQTKYEITLIDDNPESEFIMKLAKLQSSKFIRTYQANNLYHTIFTLF